MRFKNLKNVLLNPRLNPNPHSCNTPFLTTFSNLKEYYWNKYVVEVNLKYFYVIFCAKLFIKSLIFKPTVHCTHCIAQIT